MVPSFSEGDFETGILKGLVEVEKKIINDPEYVDNYTSNDVSQICTFRTCVLTNPFFMFICIMIILSIIKYVLRKKYPEKFSENDDSLFIPAASNIFFRGGNGGFSGGSLGGGFSSGGGSFGGGGFSGKF